MTNREQKTIEIPRGSLDTAMGKQTVRYNDSINQTTTGRNSIDIPELLGLKPPPGRFMHATARNSGGGAATTATWLNSSAAST
eukprot:CAMPEP_0170504326 /NCGR_PEP_ID=MMETSP0208-20121228/47570_1 /TAXON_ID=197538 /ORGANISM="Strombidium inclinatum, Strain S3" /LENGTH=82 /DNA_ID=CAMNT_0010784519 /DNA_START=23 /DNA_END=268 /DNA_ORIENTATION=+